MHIPSTAFILALGLGIGLTGLALPHSARAQNLTFAPMQSDPKAPVTITADQLNVDQTTGVAVFTGNVVAIQENMRMNGDRVTVDYMPDDRSQVRTVTAEGNVLLVTPSEEAEGKHAVYDVQAGKVVMTGDVVLTQGQNVMNGPRLSIDLRTSTGVMDGQGGRIRTVIQPGQKK